MIGIHPSLNLFLTACTLVQLAVLLLTTCTTVVDLLAAATQLELGEQILLLSTESACPRGIATSLVILQAISVTQSSSTGSTCLGGVHTTTNAACARSFYCCAEFHLFMWDFAPCWRSEC